MVTLLLLVLNIVRQPSASPLAARTPLVHLVIAIQRVSLSARSILLGAPGAQTRGATPVPEQFSIERLSVLSAGREDLPECQQ